MKDYSVSIGKEAVKKVNLRYFYRLITSSYIFSSVKEKNDFYAVVRSLLSIKA